MEILGLVTVPNWFLYTTAFIILAYIYYTWNYGLFTKLGIPGPKPIPILGNLNQFFEHGFAGVDKALIEKYGKVVGMYLGRDPRLIIADVNVLRRILIKDFPSFADRGPLPLRGIVKLSLIDSKGEHWRDLRHLLTPAFTSGKLKQMMGLIRICGDRFVSTLGEKCETNEEIELKEYCSAFTMDAIASTAFGLQVDTQSNKNDPVLQHALKIVALDVFNPWVIIPVIAPFLLPVLERLGVQSAPNDSVDFFCKIVRATLKDRRQGIGVRLDILQMMLDAEQHLQTDADEETKEDLANTGGHTSHKKHKELMEDDIVAQSLIFFVAGFDTTASTMSFLLYEITINQEIQDKLYTEIKDVIGTKEPSHDDLHKLPYLEMCLNETLRMYPPLSAVDRFSNQDFEYNGVKIPKDTVVAIPIKALHYDPEIWPQPQKFDPERFTPDAKASRDSMYYMPFGQGPRNCIGMRLAQMELKLALVKILRQYRIVPCDKTQIPLKLKKTVLVAAEKGIWVKIERRT